MNVVHLMASPFVGGPERQVLGLAESLPAEYRTSFLSFAERGLSRPFLDRARAGGFQAHVLSANAPHPFRAAREVAGYLHRLRADVLCCSGYKPDAIGWLAARRAGVPVVAIAHGWTAVTWKVRCYELLDRLVLRGMDATVCVSAAQAARVRRAGVAPEKVVVIRNAVRAEAFAGADPVYRQLLQDYFPRPCSRIVVAAGRLSPEKGIDQLIEAAALLKNLAPEVGVVVFGEGPLRESLEARVRARGLEDTFVLAGFRSDLERVLPSCDLVVLPSYTEGLPVILLEAQAAGVPVVATAVGGTPEAVEDGASGYLVPPGDPVALARRMGDVLGREPHRKALGEEGRRRVREGFTFAAQANRYQELFRRLVRGGAEPAEVLVGPEGLS